MGLNYFKMKYLKIPMSRVGVLIGQNGETKKELETRLDIELDINSREGEVVIKEKEETDPLNKIKAQNIVKAIGRGFSPEKALRLMKDDSDFFVFDLREYVKKKGKHLRRLKGRVIGKQGKTKNILEQLTGSYISVFGHTISVISDIENMNIMKKSIDMLLTGSKQATVYKFVEREMKELRLQKRYDI